MRIGNPEGWAQIVRSSPSDEWTKDRATGGHVDLIICDWRLERLSATFQLQFSTGLVTGQIAGSVPVDPGYD